MSVWSQETNSANTSWLFGAWRSPDARWERLAPLLPLRQPPALGYPRPRVDARWAMQARFFGLRTGGQWKALLETGLWASRSAQRRCQAWREAEGCVALWVQGRGEEAAVPGLEGQPFQHESCCG